MKKLLFVLFLFSTTAVWGQTLENNEIKLTFHSENAAFDVLDKASGHSWKAMTQEVPLLKTSNIRTQKTKIEFDFLYMQLKETFHGILELSGRELLVQITGKPATNQTGIRIEYPYPFEAQKGERILLPHGCGFAFPVDMIDLKTELIDNMRVYCRDMRMGVWGQYAEEVSPKG
ncbi:MAG: hypothetical protein PHQ75_11365, partial [Thermoguttaceae bacterium]|nr:hypothetical protein [Thermoguttaceae bacterium]